MGEWNILLSKSEIDTISLGRKDIPGNQIDSSATEVLEIDKIYKQSMNLDIGLKNY
jgi:hypothetical protein